MGNGRGGCCCCLSTAQTEALLWQLDRTRERGGGGGRGGREDGATGEQYGGLRGTERRGIISGGSRSLLPRLLE